jgi:asparagine synthase (glutamine-hydrolysing)
MMLADAMTYLPDDIMVKVDRANMAVALEGRAPLLDYRVIEHAWRMPLSAKLTAEGSKWPLREILYKMVPRELIDRPKMGFGVPMADWLRGPLRPWAEALLDKARIQNQGLLDPEVVWSTWKEHISGKRNWQAKLWNILMLQAWWDETRPTI